MPVVALIGAQWGDEGKGKVIDLLAGTFQAVVRCQGGANAGHTVVVGGKKTVLHLLPSGVLHDARCVIGAGVVMDPVALCQELDELRAGGCDAAPRLLISDRTHLVTPAMSAATAQTRLSSSYHALSIGSPDSANADTATCFF